MILNFFVYILCIPLNTWGTRTQRNFTFDCWRVSGDRLVIFTSFLIYLRTLKRVHGFLHDHCSHNHGSVKNAPVACKWNAWNVPRLVRTQSFHSITITFPRKFLQQFGKTVNELGRFQIFKGCLIFHQDDCDQRCSKILWPKNCDSPKKLFSFRKLKLYSHPPTLPCKNPTPKHVVSGRWLMKDLGSFKI